MAAGRMVLKHALSDDVCTDPDCEIHNPWVIETLSEAETALAWFYAGMVFGQKVDPQLFRAQLLGQMISTMPIRVIHEDGSVEEV